MLYITLFLKTHPNSNHFIYILGDLNARYATSTSQNLSYLNVIQIKWKKTDPTLSKQQAVITCGSKRFDTASFISEEK